MHLRRIFQQPLVAYRCPRNLQDLLVDTRQHGITSSLANDNGTFPCQSALCKTCVLVYNLMDLPFGDRQVYHVTGRYNCAASAVVYLITCSVCDAAYVGETGRTLRERMIGHRQDIRSHADTPVALHFGESTHNIRVSVIQQAPCDTVQRRTAERGWIKKVRDSSPFTVLNRNEGMDILLL